MIKTAMTVTDDSNNQKTVAQDAPVLFEHRADRVRPSARDNDVKYAQISERLKR